MNPSNVLQEQSIIQESGAVIAPDDLKDSKILLVDDMDFNLMLLQQMFRSAGMTNTLQARGGEEALQLTHSEKPDLVVLDLLMPGMDGFEYIAAVRAIPEFRHLPIIVQTASSGMQEKRRVFKAGASDFVVKPLEQFEMLSRCFIHLERRLAYTKLESAQKRLQEEVEQARTMQESILPSPEQINAISARYPAAIRHLFRFSSELGGDMWGVTPVNDDIFCLYTADFSGHGIAAALNTFRLDTLARQAGMYRSSPGRYMSSLNSGLYSLLQRGQFATMFYGAVDTAAREITYCCAASPAPVLIRADGKIQMLEGKGFPLAALRDSVFEEHTVSYTPGDTLFLYSDALIETETGTDDAGEPVYLSEKEVAAAIAAVSAEHAGDAKARAAAVGAYLRRVYETSVKARQADDLTMICVLF